MTPAERLPGWEAPRRLQLTPKGAYSNRPSEREETDEAGQGQRAGRAGEFRRPLLLCRRLRLDAARADRSWRRIRLSLRRRRLRCC